MAQTAVATAACAAAWAMLQGGASLQRTAVSLLLSQAGEEYGFTLLELDGRGHLRGVEWKMPPLALVAKGNSRIPWGGPVPLAGEPVLLREDKIQPGELCCAFSREAVEGKSGQGLSWGRQGALAFLGRAYTGKESARYMKELFFSACRGLEESPRPAVFFCRARALCPLLLAVGVPQGKKAGLWGSVTGGRLRICWGALWPFWAGKSPGRKESGTPGSWELCWTGNAPACVFCCPRARERAWGWKAFWPSSFWLA